MVYEIISENLRGTKCHRTNIQTYGTFARINPDISFFVCIGSSQKKKIGPIMRVTRSGDETVDVAMAYAGKRAKRFSLLQMDTTLFDEPTWIKELKQEGEDWMDTLNNFIEAQRQEATEDEMVPATALTEADKQWAKAYKKKLWKYFESSNILELATIARAPYEFQARRIHDTYVLQLVDLMMADPFYLNSLPQFLVMRAVENYTEKALPEYLAEEERVAEAEYKEDRAQPNVKYWIFGGNHNIRAMKEMYIKTEDATFNMHKCCIFKSHLEPTDARYYGLMCNVQAQSYGSDFRKFDALNRMDIL